jgi:hypothetical protein
MLRCELNAADFRKPGNIQHRSRQRPVAQSRENIRAARKNGGAGVCKNVESFLKRIRPKIQTRWLPGEAEAMRTLYFYNATLNL